jgi:DNA-directed RNA polymerase specialized sigma24 family protein
MRELSVTEQRYQAVLAVISDGLSIRQVADKWGVSRLTLHSWLARYEAQCTGVMNRFADAVAIEIDDERGTGHLPRGLPS